MSKALNQHIRLNDPVISNKNNNLAIVKKDGKYISNASRVVYYPLAVKSAKGAIVVDEDDNIYIDMLSSAGSINTGHCHPRVVDAILKQANNLILYTPAYMYHRNLAELAEKITQITPGKFEKKVTFGLSGSDAVDGAIKLARYYTKRQKIVSFIRSYHGSTYGALSLSACSLNMRRNLGPFLPEIYHVAYPDCYRCPYGLRKENCSFHCIKYIQYLFENYIPAEEVAAIIIEPIQGDAGIIVPPDGFLSQLKTLCEKYEILFIVDEIQQGFGRTGKWFSIEHWNIEPDIMVLGKAIASGMPLSAIVARKEILDSWSPPAHLFTTGGNPIACAAALATINVIEDEQLVERSAELGEYVKSKFYEMMNKYSIIGDVRGKGLSIGVDIVKNRITKERDTTSAAKICYRSWQKGLLLTFFSGSVLRIQPPLVISKEQIDNALDIIESSIIDLLNNKIPDEVLNTIKGW